MFGALLSAALTVLAFPPLDLSPLIWVSLVPLFLSARPVRAAFAFAFLISIGGTYWIATALHQYGHFPWPLAILGLGAFALFNQAAFPMAAWILDRTQRPALNHPLIAALLVTGLDWAFPKLFLDTLGHALYRDVHLRQVADLGGVHALTFLILWVNASFARAIHTRSVRSGLWPLFAIALSFSYGFLRLHSLAPTLRSPIKKVSVAVVQPNIGNVEKTTAEAGGKEASAHVLDRLIGLSEKALLDRPDAILWPETAYPGYFRSPQNAIDLANERRVKAFNRDSKTPLWLGGYDAEEMRAFNSIFFLHPDREPGPTRRLDVETYRKHVLLPFGESIPGASYLPALDAMFPQVGNFGRGPGPTVLGAPLRDQRSVRVAPLICYEAVIANFTRAGANLGAEFLLNVTNDSWFGRYGEPQQHLAFTTFRSIETRLPQLRSTNTGVTALIDATGTIVDPGPIAEEWVHTYTIDITAPIGTLFKLLGDWFGPLALLVSIGHAGQVALRKRSRARASSLGLAAEL